MLGKYYAIQVLDLKVRGHGISRGYIDTSLPNVGVLSSFVAYLVACSTFEFGQESLIDSFISDGMMR